MATTRIYYKGNGSTRDFSIPFDYLAKRFVQVLVDYQLQQAGASSDMSADYYFANNTTIRFRVAPASDTQIQIKRFTDATDRIVNFNDGSVLLADDLNAAQLQTIHIAEEGRDIIDDALVVDVFGNWDARNRRIINLADPVDPTDAMPYGMYLADGEGSKVSAEEAKAAAEAAKASEEAAKASELAAAESATAAEAAAEAAVQTAADMEVRAEELITEMANTAAQIVSDFTETAEEYVETMHNYSQDATNKFDAVVKLADEITAKAEETLKAFEEAKQEVTEATQTVVEIKDYIEEIVNNNVVQSGLACARSTWVLEEDLPAGTVIRMEGSPTYVVGRKHLFISYDGIVMSPTFYNEVGEFNTTSTEVSFNFDLFKGQELTAWVVTLGNSDSEIYDRLTNIEAEVTQAKEAIEELQGGDTNIGESILQLNTAVEELRIYDSTFAGEVETAFSGVSTTLQEMAATDEEFRREIEMLKEQGGSSGTPTLWDGFGHININDVASITATTYEDTFSIMAGDNVTLTTDEELKKLTISVAVPDVPLELVIVDNIDDVPAELKIGGLALVKEGYDE